MHQKMGNPSNLPYICCLFDAPQIGNLMIPLYPPGFFSSAPVPPLHDEHEGLVCISLDNFFSVPVDLAFLGGEPMRDALWNVDVNVYLKIYIYIILQYNKL